MVDWEDDSRSQEAKEVLHKTLKNTKIKGVPLLVIANKKGNDWGNKSRWGAEELELNTLKDRKWVTS